MSAHAPHTIDARRESIETSPVLDRSLYPDVPVPTALETDADKADYLQRFCCAWDFGIGPDGTMLLALRGWRDIADRFPIPSSPAYHALRLFFRWPDLPAEPFVAYTLTQDEREGRTDPCQGWF